MKKKEILRPGKGAMTESEASLEFERILRGETIEGFGSQERRKATIKDAGDMIELDLSKYEEPQRSGTAKGEPIGFSKKKLRTAYWMILFPDCLSLKEIAEKCGISEGVLRVWRTQEDFKEKSQKYAEYVGDRLMKFLRIWWEERAMDEFVRSDSALIVGDSIAMRKSYAEKHPNLKPKGKKVIVINDAPDREFKGTYIKFSQDAVWELLTRLPFYNVIVIDRVISGFKKLEDIPGAFCEMALLYKAAFFWKADNLKLRKEWERRFLDSTHTVIEKVIDVITDPEFRKQFSDKEAQEHIGGLKNIIREVITILAHE